MTTTKPDPIDAEIEKCEARAAGLRTLKSEINRLQTYTTECAQIRKAITGIYLPTGRLDP